MLRIRCIHCGVRDEEEFTFGGPSHVSRPGLSCDDAEWADYLFNRDNPKGMHYERWYHAFGCQRWFNVARNTVTHEVLAIYPMGQARPDLDSCEGTAVAFVSRRGRMAVAASDGKRPRNRRFNEVPD